MVIACELNCYFCFALWHFYLRGCKRGENKRLIIVIIISIIALWISSTISNKCIILSGLKPSIYTHWVSCEVSFGRQFDLPLRNNLSIITKFFNICNLRKHVKNVFFFKQKPSLFINLFSFYCSRYIWVFPGTICKELRTFQFVSADVQISGKRNSNLTNGIIQLILTIDTLYFHYLY